MEVIRAHQDQLIATQTKHTAILRQIHQHLSIFSPPKHDMPGPSEPTDPSQEAPPVEQTMPHEETTIVEIETLIQSTQTVKIWLNSLRPRSIRAWTDLQVEFLKKFFPTHRQTT